MGLARCQIASVDARNVDLRYTDHHFPAPKFTSLAEWEARSREHSSIPTNARMSRVRGPWKGQTYGGASVVVDGDGIAAARVNRPSVTVRCNLQVPTLECTMPIRMAAARQGTGAAGGETRCPNGNVRW